MDHVLHKGAWARYTYCEVQMSIKLTDEQRKLSIVSIKRYVQEELERRRS